MIRQLASFVMVVFASVSSAHAAEAQPVIKRIGDEYEVVLTGRFGDDESAWQVAVAPTVATLCGTEVPQWGRFKLMAMSYPAKGKPLEPGRFVQRIKCVEPPPAVSDGPTAPFAPTAADDAGIAALTTRFFALRDAGDTTATFALLGAGLASTTDRAEWDKSVRAEPALIRGGAERKVSKVTWYVDPPGADPGVYAAADFDGRTRNLVVHCGYLAFKRQPDGSFRIVRIEEGRMTVRDAAKMSADQLTAARASLRCRT